MFDALFTTTTEYKKLSHALSGKGACALFGLPASGRAQVYAALCRQLDKPLCIVFQQKELKDMSGKMLVLKQTQIAYLR